MKAVSGNTSKGGHYSLGIISHRMLYISGQLPIDPAIGKLAAEQAKTALYMSFSCCANLYSIFYGAKIDLVT